MKIFPGLVDTLILQVNNLSDDSIVKIREFIIQYEKELPKTPVAFREELEKKFAHILQMKMIIPLLNNIHLISCRQALYEIATKLQ